jgi:hypothetical protein
MSCGPLEILADKFAVVERRCNRASVLILGKDAASIFDDEQNGLISDTNQVWGADLVRASLDDESMFIVVGCDGGLTKGVLK